MKYPCTNCHGEEARRVDTGGAPLVAQLRPLAGTGGQNGWDTLIAYRVTQQASVLYFFHFPHISG